MTKKQAYNAARKFSHVFPEIIICSFCYNGKLEYGIENSKKFFKTFPDERIIGICKNGVIHLK